MGFVESFTISNIELTRLFFAIALLLLLAHFFGYLFHRFKLPKVVGEIFGGLLAGPTVLGFLFPDVHEWLFNAFESEGKMISVIYWLGLVLLMFVSGFEIQKKLVKGDKRIIIAILLGATVIPLIAGWLITSFYDFSPYLGVKNNMLALKIVIAIAVAVTSIPVISRIFIDLDIMKTRFARIVLATATIQDVILWVALAIATGLVSAASLPISGIISTVVVTIAFFAVALLVMPKFLGFIYKSRYNLLIRSSVSGYALFICFLFAAISSLLNINIVFGAFLAGIVVGLMPEEQFGKEKKYIKEVSLAFFIPLYFAIVGLKLDLIHHFDLLFFLGFLLFTTAIEGIGTLIAAKLIKRGWLSCFNLAVAMNTRGGPGIVLATVALDIGIINETFFVTLVLVAIVTSLMAGFWFRYVISKGWQLLKD